MNWRFWTFWKKKKQVLLVMRAKDMVLAHPNTDWLHECKTCHEPVGIYPSGQGVLSKFGEANVDIVCSHCSEQDPLTGTLAPGGEAEPGQSIWNTRYKRG